HAFSQSQRCENEVLLRRTAGWDIIWYANTRRLLDLYRRTAPWDLRLHGPHFVARLLSDGPDQWRTVDLVEQARTGQAADSRTPAADGRRFWAARPWIRTQTQPPDSLL